MMNNNLENYMSKSVTSIIFLFFPGLHFESPVLTIRTEEVAAQTHELCVLYTQADGMPPNVTAYVKCFFFIW